MRRPLRAVRLGAGAACGPLLAPLLALALAPPARGAEPEDEAVLATLPFEPSAPDRTIVIDLAPEGNSRPLRFQLDTGATNSIVTPKVARAMGVKVSRIKQDAYRRRARRSRPCSRSGWRSCKRSSSGAASRTS